MVFVSGTIGLVVRSVKRGRCCVDHPHVDVLVLGTPHWQPSGKSGKLALARVKKPKLREPPEFMREEERIKQLEANQKRWDKYLLDCLVAETRAVRVPPMPCDL